MRTFSQSESTRMSSLQGTKSQSAHRHRSHRIQVHTNQYPQVPIVSLVPCSTLPNTVPHTSRPMRPNELPQNTFSINTPLRR